MESNNVGYGIGDSSYKMAGELPGIIKLVNDFYDNMDTLSKAKNIRSMHSTDLSDSKKKLSYFLSGWLGGPKLYTKHYGSINIPMAHKHLKVGIEESEAWLLCMKKSVDNQPYEKAFKLYLMDQLSVPAERIRMIANI